MKSLFSAVSVDLGSLPGPVPAWWRCLSMVASIQRLRTGSWMMVSGPKILKCSRCHWSWSENTWMKFLEKHCVTLRLLWCSKVALNSILHLYTSTLKFSMESQYEQHSVAYSKPLQFEIACLYHTQHAHTHIYDHFCIHIYLHMISYVHLCALRPQRGLGWILDTTCFEWKNAQFKSQSEEVKSSHWMPGQMFQVQNRFPSWWSLPPKRSKRCTPDLRYQNMPFFGKVSWDGLDLLGRLRKRLSGKILDHPYVAAQAEVMGQGLKASGCCFGGCSKGWG